ncbi:MAG: sporulation protein YabP [Eubacterium sp.]|nr:sporulation protein YabP [Eubacterium sp.]
METKMKKNHNLFLENRSGLKLTGVTDVDSFDEETVTAYTDYGCLTVNGSKLHVEELNLDSGVLEITGEVVALVYSSRTEKGSGFFKRIFQ